MKLLLCELAACIQDSTTKATCLTRIFTLDDTFMRQVDASADRNVTKIRRHFLYGQFAILTSQLQSPKQEYCVPD